MLHTSFNSRDQSKLQALAPLLGKPFQFYSNANISSANHMAATFGNVDLNVEWSVQVEVQTEHHNEQET